MKKTQIRPLLILLLPTILTFISACDPSDHPVPDKTCKLTGTNSSTIYTSGATSSKNSTLEYNTAGLPATYKTSSKDINSSQEEIQSSNTTTQYTYNSDGYLIKLESESNYIQTVSEFKTLYTADYEYNAGRVVTVTAKATTGTYVYDYKSTYEYNGAGKVTTYSTTTTTDNSTSLIVYDFIENKLIMSEAGDVVREGVLDADGYLTEINQAGVDIRYQYDSEGNLTRREEWIDDKLTIAFKYTYDAKPDPINAFLRIAQQKGIPDLKLVRTTSPIHNYKTETELMLNDQNEEIVVTTTDHNIEYNTSDFPTKATITEKGSTGTVISTTTATYAYDFCE